MYPREVLRFRARSAAVIPASSRYLERVVIALSSHNANLLASAKFAERDLSGVSKGGNVLP